MEGRRILNEAQILEQFQGPLGLRARVKVFAVSPFSELSTQTLISSMECSAKRQARVVFMFTMAVAALSFTNPSRETVAGSAFQHHRGGILTLYSWPSTRTE